MDNPKLIKHLEQIGLTDKSALIYAYLLESGGSFPSIISQKTNLNRSTVYKILIDLVEKDLVSETEKSKKLYYKINNPEQLLKYTNNEIKQANERHENAERLIPRLVDFFSSNEGRPKINFFGGVNTYEEILNKITTESSDKNILIFSNPSIFSNYLDDKTIKDFIKNKEKQNFQTKEIMPDNQENREYYDKTFILAKKQLTPKVRFVSIDKYNFESNIFIFDQNKIAILKNTSNNLNAIILEDQAIHDTFKKIFEICWLQGIS